MNKDSENLIINRKNAKVFLFRNVEDLEGKPGYNMLGGTFSDKIIANDFVAKSLAKGWILNMFGVSSDEEVSSGRPVSVLFFK